MLDRKAPQKKKACVNETCCTSAQVEQLVRRSFKSFSRETFCNIMVPSLCLVAEINCIDFDASIKFSKSIPQEN